MSLVEKYFPKELYGVLKALERERKEITAMRIPELAGVSHSFLLNTLPSLRVEGFVSVTKGEKDKREKHVRLTDGGRHLLEALEYYRASLEGKHAPTKSLAKGK